MWSCMIFTINSTTLVGALWHPCWSLDDEASWEAASMRVEVFQCRFECLDLSSEALRVQVPKYKVSTQSHIQGS